jgi:hypothetical protein
MGTFRRNDDLYFMLSAQFNVIKIGRSWNPVERRNQLRRECNDLIIILGVSTGNGWRERALHAHFRPLKAKHPNSDAGREWYKDDPDLRKYIEHFAPDHPDEEMELDEEFLRNVGGFFSRGVGTLPNRFD